MIENKKLLDVQWLKQARESSWLLSYLNDYQVPASEPETVERQDFNSLFAAQEYASAAQALIELCEQQWDEPDPFEIAIAKGNAQLVAALLAQTNLAAYGFENNLLAMAVAYNQRAIFNLLLLHPDIEVQCSYEANRKAREVAEFCGVWDWCDHYCPQMWLMEPQYEGLYPLLEIDWQHSVNGDDSAPLLVHLYRQRDFVGMNRLVAIGAEINPVLDKRDTRERLIHLALEDWRDDKLESQQGLKWFARYMSFLNDPSFDADVLSDLLSLNKPQIASLFQLDAITCTESGADEQDEALSEPKTQYSALETAIFTALPYSPPRQHPAYSLTDDLLRLDLVEFVAEVKDLQFVMTDKGIEFGIFYQNHVFAQSLLLPMQVLERLDFRMPLPIQVMTAFQCQAWLLTCPSELYLWLNVLAQDAGYPLFRSVRNHPICNIERQLKISAILAISDIEDKHFLVERLQQELHRFESILHILSAQRLLKTPFLQDAQDDLNVWRRQGTGKQPKLALDVLTQNDSVQVAVHALVNEQWCELGTRQIERDWVSLLFEAPIFIPCQQCGDTFYRHSLAYEQECMECINRPSQFDKAN